MIMSNNELFTVYAIYFCIAECIQMTYALFWPEKALTHASYAIFRAILWITECYHLIIIEV